MITEMKKEPKFKKNILKYTTVTGINGFDGSKKKSESPIVKSL